VGYQVRLGTDGTNVYYGQYQVGNDGPTGDYSPNPSPKAHKNVITNINVGGDGGFLAYTYVGGVSPYAHLLDSSLNYAYPSPRHEHSSEVWFADHLPRGAISDIEYDSAGNVWFVTFDSGDAELHMGTIEHMQYGEGYVVYSEKLATIEPVFEGPFGGNRYYLTWCAANSVMYVGGLAASTPNKFRFAAYDGSLTVKEFDAPALEIVHQVGVDSDGVIYIPCASAFVDDEPADGVYLFDTDGNQVDFWPAAFPRAYAHGTSIMDPRSCRVLDGRNVCAVIARVRSWTGTPPPYGVYAVCLIGPGLELPDWWAYHWEDKDSMGHVPGIHELTDDEGVLHPEHIIDMRTVIEALAPLYRNNDTLNPWNFDDGSADNLYYVAMGDRTQCGATGGAAYDWTRTKAEMLSDNDNNLYDIDIVEILSCIETLEGSVTVEIHLSYDWTVSP